MTKSTQHRAWISGIRLQGGSAVLALSVMLGFGVAVPQSAQARSYKVLYAFRGTQQKKHDGKNSQASVVRDAAGNLYGTTLLGGDGGGGGTYGTVFKVDTTGKETVLHSFLRHGDGKFPYAGLLLDASGNFFGTTSQGGDFNRGTVFQLSPTGEETLLYSFAGGADGAGPYAGVTMDNAGNLYGTTAGGGRGYGTVFKIDTTGKETVLYSFAGSPDGANPYAGVVMDVAGNLYSTTVSGGNSGGCATDGGCGVVFKLDATGKESVLYNFTGTPDGAFPYGGVVMDASGNLYGTTAGDGSGGCPGNGCGTVFKIDTSGTETVLHSFTGLPDGVNPHAGLIIARGILYGTTVSGGPHGSGTVFKVDKSGKETVLHTFTGKDGYNPFGGLIRDAKGNLYGTTSSGGGYGFGAVFKLTP